MCKQLLLLFLKVALKIIQNISLCYNYKEKKTICFELQSYYQTKTYDTITIRLVVIYKISYQNHSDKVA